MRFSIGNTRLTAALSAALLVIVTSAGWAQQQGTIAGTVTDRVAGTPLAGARISILGTNRSAVTNQEGRYTLAGVPVGAYQVQTSLIGYGAATNIRMESGGESSESGPTVAPGQISVRITVSVTFRLE